MQIQTRQAGFYFCFLFLSKPADKAHFFDDRLISSIYLTKLPYLLHLRKELLTTITSYVNCLFQAVKMYCWLRMFSTYHIT